MKIRNFINLCGILLWFSATHHCAFHGIIETFTSHTRTLTVLTSDNNSQISRQDALAEASYAKHYIPEHNTPEHNTLEHCTSHSTEDPFSHTEGASCSNPVQSGTISELRSVNNLTAVPLDNIFVVSLSNASMHNLHQARSTNLSLNEHEHTSLFQRFFSLSIAANAPPTFA